MKRLFFVAALCGAVMLGGCMETTYQQQLHYNHHNHDHHGREWQHHHYHYHHYR